MQSCARSRSSLRDDEEESSLSEGRSLLVTRSGSRELPQGRAGLLSQMTFSWLTPLMHLASKRGLTANDVYDTPSENEASRNAERFEAIWNNEMKSRGQQNASVSVSLLKLVGFKLALSSVCIVVYGICALMSPAFFMNELLRYADTEKTDPLYGALLVFGMTTMELLRSLFLALAWSLNCQAGIRALSGVMTAVYRKALRLENVTALSPGEVLNLFSNDGLRIFEAFNCGIFIIGPIVSGVAAATMSLRLVGLWGLVGFAVFYCMVPFQAGLSIIGASLRLKSLSFTDLRLKLTAEAVASIRLIKQYSWVEVFFKNIQAARDKELSYLEKVTFFNGLQAAVPSILPSLASIATFTGVLLSSGSLTVIQAFTFAAALNGLRGTTTILPVSVKAISDAILAARRIKKLLVMTEISSNDSDVDLNINLFDKQAAVFSAASFSWPARHSSRERKAGQSSHGNSSTSGTCFLRDVNISIDEGKLYGVCGEVGSGKSSFIAAMAGLIPRTKGEMKIRGSIAYVAQKAWIMNATLKDNILFGLSMDEQRYHQILDCCGLVKDIALLPLGDLTEIGDRGFNLSGGQKQRISLARAVYSDRDIYLLDDPFSAVDACVGKYIHEKCVNGVLKEKTVILVTNQLQFLHGSNVLFVKDGRITVDFANSNRINFCGGQSDITHLERAIAVDADRKQPAAQERKEHCKRKRGSQTYFQTSSVPLLKLEFLEKGRVTWQACKGYLQAASSRLVSLSLMLIVATTIVTTMSVWWLSYWLQNKNDWATVANALHVEPLFMAGVNADKIGLIIYATSIGAAVILLVFKSASYTKMSTRASDYFHTAVLSKVLQSPIEFFELTPTGQIINRFSKDIDEMDSMFPLSMESAIQNTLSIVGSMVLVSIGLPYLSVIIAAMLVVVIILYRRLSSGVRELKRLEHSARSRWFSHIETTMQGLSTIRAYGKEQPFTDRFNELTDAYSMTLGLYNNSLRWLAVRFDTIHIAITAITGCLIAFLPKSMAVPARAALAICNSLSLAGVLQYTVRLLIESECRFLSAERLQSYMKELQSEEDNCAKEIVSEHWPNKGEIAFENVSLRYRPGHPTALKAISFKIRAKEKIGIVGRTGSGKSSLGVTLFRLAEIDSGRVEIDGVDIRQVPLQLLRSRLSIIPQEPTLFIGTLRYNLDPAGSHTDSELQSSLNKCNLVSDRFSNGLDTHIVEGGENMSVGERQLICMARALLRRSKILMMDEATASMDSTTSKLLMNAVTEAFADCTVLIIAHRLNTVLQCDRIMVLDNGNIADFETPEKLLKNESSLFYQMLKSATNVEN